MDRFDEMQRIVLQVSDIYAQRFGIERDATWHIAKLGEELGELQAAFLKLQGQGRDSRGVTERRQAMEDEVADLFAQVILFADWQKVDIEEAIRRKWGRHLKG